MRFYVENGVSFLLVLFAKSTHHLRPTIVQNIIKRPQVDFSSLIDVSRSNYFVSLDFNQERRGKKVEIPTAWLKACREILETKKEGIDRTTEFDKTRFWPMKSIGSCMRTKRGYGKVETNT
jgi:hypothetical protein